MRRRVSTRPAAQDFDLAGGQMSGRVIAMVAGSAVLTAAILFGSIVFASDGRAVPASDGTAMPVEFDWPTPDKAGLTHYAEMTTRVPPAPAAAPLVSMEQALAIAQSLEFGDLAPGRPRVSLRLASRSLPADTADGFRDRLSWIVEYPNSPLILGGPPGLSTLDRQKMVDTSRCEFVVVIDATSGAPLASLQVCHTVETSTGR